MKSILLMLALSAFALPASAFDYVVGGRAQNVVVDVDDELFWTGTGLAIAGYATPILVGGLMSGQREGEGQFVPLGLSSVPVVGGGLLGNFFLDQMEAQDAREGWAVMPAGMMWLMSIGQAVGLCLVAGSLITADRTLVLNE